jgi:hypothetical protein
VLAGRALDVPVAPALDGSPRSEAVDDAARSDAGDPRACGRRGPYPAVLGPGPPADQHAAEASRSAASTTSTSGRPRSSASSYRSGSDGRL